MQGPKLRNPKPVVSVVEPSKIVVIGASLGGLQALQTVLAALPAGFPLPVAVVQHQASDADETRAELLPRYTTSSSPSCRRSCGPR